MRAVTRVLPLVVVLVVLTAAGLVSLKRSGLLPPHRTASAQEQKDARGLDASGRTPAETHAVLAAQKELAVRAAEDDDASESESRTDLENLYSDYHPFFVRGDLDGDGHLDFAQAFVEKKGAGSWFDVAVLFGRADGTFSPPVFVEKGITLSPGDLSIERSLLILTPDVSRDDARRWRYEPGEKRFVDADSVPKVESPSDEDGPDETPDQRPRARV